MDAQEIKAIAQEIAAIIPRSEPAIASQCTSHQGLVQEIKNINNQYFELNQTIKKMQSGQETLISKLVKVEKKIINDKLEDERRRNEKLEQELSMKLCKEEKAKNALFKSKQHKIAQFIAGTSIFVTLVGQIVAFIVNKP